MSYKPKLKIGEFSQLMQVTVKTLRHYETLGLLLPDEVDDWTGYRYYRIEQMQRLNDIRRLKDLGFSLDEIKELYEDDSHKPSLELLDAKIKDCEAELKRLMLRHEQLRTLADSQKNIQTMDKFTIQSLPAIMVASHRQIIPNYPAIGDMCCNVIGPEMQRLGCKCAATGYCFTVEHNKEFSPTDIDIEYCEEVSEEFKGSSIVECKTLEAIPTALCMKHYGPYDRFHESYTELFKYLEENGYKIIGQFRCCYIDGIWNQEDPEKWLSIIQVPVEKI